MAKNAFAVGALVHVIVVGVDEDEQLVRVLGPLGLALKGLLKCRFRSELSGGYRSVGHEHRGHKRAA